MLKEKTIYIPPMDYDSARVLAAVLRTTGLKAEPLPPSDERTSEMRDRFTSGDECHPFQILAGDVMKLLQRGDVDPAQSIFFLLSSGGSCRFSRFVPDLREILERSGYGQAEIFAPDLSDGHRGLNELGEDGLRSVWRALISAGVLRKLLLFYRPYEMTKGDTDKAYEESLHCLCSTIESTTVASLEQFDAIRTSLLRVRDRFRAIPMKEERSAPLIGIVGEVFCRFNPLLNNDLIRQLENRGGQARLAGLTEEVRLCLRNSHCTIDELNQDNVAFIELFRDEFPKCGKPDIDELLEYATPYLSVERGFTEVAFRLGQIISLAKQGVDGIIDASPFPCMNSSACAAFYTKLGQDLDGLPIRRLYFNGTKRDWSTVLDEFLGLARVHREHKEERRIL